MVSFTLYAVKFLLIYRHLQNTYRFKYEDETGVQVSDVGFVRRVSYDELGREVCKMYVTEVEVKL